MNEALAMLEDDDLQNLDPTIVLLPPENACGDITDEDSGDENLLEVDNLPASQLRAPAEVVFSRQKEDSDFDEEDDIPLSNLCKKTKTSKSKKRKLDCRWTAVPFDPPKLSEDWPTVSIDMEEKTPLQLYENFFDDELIDIIVNETNRYAAQKNKNNNISKTEIKAFFGVLILSGYNQVSRRRMYWEREKDTHNELVANAISRDRFEFIMSHLHMVDNNNLDQSDKFAKLRPLFNTLNRSFLKFAPLEKSHSVDEAMVPYYGRHGCKQFIHGKPIRYGFKLWMGCTRLGYVNWFQPYQGASTHPNLKYKDLGVGAEVILSYADVLKSKWRESKFHLYFDNFFSSIPLFSKLGEKQLQGTGTIRTNRIPNNPFSKQKHQRGHYTYKTCANPNIIVVQWNDNSLVTIGSNAVGIDPVHKVTRYSQKEKKRIQVDQPHLIKLYNENMGGVDRLDENLSLYRTSIRGKKWYFSLFIQCIDMAIQNAWQLHRLCEGNMDHLAFKRYIAKALLLGNKKTTATFCKGRPRQNENQLIKYDRIEHWVIPQDKQTKCRHCHQKTTTRCEKCDIGLHVKCFKDYHT